MCNLSYTYMYLKLNYFSMFRPLWIATGKAGRHDTKGVNKITQTEKVEKQLVIFCITIFPPLLEQLILFSSQVSTSSKVSFFSILKRIIFPWKISGRKTKPIYILAIQNQFSSQDRAIVLEVNRDLFFSDRPTTLYHHSRLVMEFLYDFIAWNFVLN